MPEKILIVPKLPKRQKHVVVEISFDILGKFYLVVRRPMLILRFFVQGSFYYIRIKLYGKYDFSVVIVRFF